MKLRRALFWLVLALPAAMMARAVAGGTPPADLLHPSGELSLRLMILAMLAGPLSACFTRSRFLRGWLAIRRNLGVAAFCYGAVHLALYVIDMGTVAAMIDELGLPAIWTGWAGFAMMLVAASISTDGAVRALGARWKQVQRLVYPALLLVLVHWGLIDRNWGPALVHAAPLLLAWMARAWIFAKRKG